MKNNKYIIEKLTALWALNESGLGGFLHVFNSPFTGLIVGGVSILLISLIAYYAENKWQAILKALVIVLIIKMAVSPYSPFGAYVAVSFQAVLGAILFSNFSWKGATIMVLGMVTTRQASSAHSKETTASVFDAQSSNPSASSSNDPNPGANMAEPGPPSGAPPLRDQ